MSIVVRPGARLLFRVDPLPGESPRGYLCRVAHEHGYGGPNALAQIAGLWVSGTGRSLAWIRMQRSGSFHTCYVSSRKSGDRCVITTSRDRGDSSSDSFYGETVSADDLNYGSPRLCPACLREHPIWWAVWDLGLVVACPIHRCILLNQCPACKRRVAWERPAVHKCRCGVDFRQFGAEPADPDLVAIDAIIYRAAGATLAQTAEADVTDLGFPPELSQVEARRLVEAGPLCRLSKGWQHITPEAAATLALRISSPRPRSAVVQSRCSETGPGRCAKYYAVWSRSQQILPRSTSARSLETSIGTCFVSFPAGNSDSFTMSSSSSLSMIGKVSSAVSTVIFPLPCGGTPNG